MLVEPGKAARPVEMKNDLHEMQQMVGGPIQALYPWEEPVAIVCNDEGKNMGGVPCGTPPGFMLPLFLPAVTNMQEHKATQNDSA